MSTIQTNAILDASGGSTTTINGVTPNAQSVVGRSLIINGDMRIDQRNGGAAVTTSGGYPVDRWNVISNTNDFTTEQDTVVPADKEFATSVKIQPTATKSPSASTYARIGYSIEGYDGVRLGWGTSAAKSATISFWVRSSVTGTYSVGVKNGAANKSIVLEYTISAADTWEYKTMTIPAETSGSWLSTNGRFAYIDIWLAGEGSQTSTVGSWLSSNANMSSNQVNFFSNTSNTFYLTGFKMEVGSVATEFDHRSYGEELVSCLRYFEKFDYANTQFVDSIGYANSSSTANSMINYSTKRAAPTITLPAAGTSGGKLAFLTGGGGYPSSIGTLSIQLPSTTSARIYGGGFGGYTIGQASGLFASGSCSITIDAEL